MVLNFNKYATKGNEFINTLAKDLGHPDEKEKTGRILYAVLHGIRDRIPVEESVQLIAQLPMFLKGIYVENWTLHGKPRIKHVEDFFSDIRKNISRTEKNDFPDDRDIKRAIGVIFLVLREYLSPGEIEDIKSVLPIGLKVYAIQAIMI